MAIQLRCTACGTMYDDTFKFCPECSTPNPRIAAKPKQHSKPKNVQAEYENDDMPVQKAPVKKKFTKIGESNLNKQARQTTEDPFSQPQAQPRPKRKQKPVPMPEPDYDYEDEYEDEAESSEYEDDFEGSDYEDDYEGSDYEDEDEYSEDEYEDEDDYEDEDVEDPEITERKISSFKSKSKTLTAPPAKRIKQTPKPPKKKVAPKKIATTTRSSLGKKKKKAYDPNHDGYYDDRLPAILDEVTKTSHIDVILKIALAIVVISALITYCIFYVNV